MPTTAPPKLTDEQQAALAAHDRSVSLAAGAGCGKTFVLTERFLSYLDPRALEPTAELHELVAITFTEAAAREMRDRIRKRAFERLAAATDPDEEQAWRRLLRSLDSARISTIHSFCGGLLRNHAVEAGLDPQFEQLDQASADLLRLRTLDERLRQLLLERDERVIQLATRFGLANLREYLAVLLGENCDAVAKKWRGKSAGDLIAVWRDHFDRFTRTQLIDELLQSDPVVQLEKVCRTAVAAIPELSALFTRLLALFTRLRDSSDPVPLLEELHQLARVQSGPAKKKNWADESDFETFKTVSAKLRDSIKNHILQRPWSEEALQETAQTGLDLLELADDVAACYKLAKQSRNALEFDDLIQKAYELLSSSRHAAVQRELAQRTRLLLVDEFQDTDPLQVAIVTAFCGEAWQEKGLFVVGDFKQSIYRFRGAEPRVSDELRDSLPKTSQLSLTTNFRSQEAILDFVNALFCDSFESKFEPLHPMRLQQTPLPAIEFLWALEDAAEQDDTIPAHLRGSQRFRYLEARSIAKRLAELIDSEVPLIVDHDTQSLRPLRQGDIAILLRSFSDVQVYEAALRDLGFDYYIAGGHAFYAQQEIHDVLHLLRAVVSMADDLSLAGALRSPLFALTDETLYWLVEHSGSLNAALFVESLPEELSDVERSKVIRAASVIHELRRIKDDLLVAELLNRAIELTGYDAVLLTEFLGERKLANLRKLVEQARTLDRVNPGDVNGFVTQLAEFVTRAPKEPVASTSGAENVVHVMTIHNAKGLEFPLVVVADLGRRSPSTDRQPVMDEDLGPLVPSIAEEKSLVGWDLYQAAEKREEQEEKLRLLYVACTRAADYLILSSSLKDPHKPTSDWLKFLGGRFDLATGDLLAKLPAGYAAPQVRVTTTEPKSPRKATSRTRRANLDKLIEQTTGLAAKSDGKIPAGVSPISPRANARRRFSFSRLSGAIVRDKPSEVVDQDPSAPQTVDSLGFGTLVHALMEYAGHDSTQRLGELAEHLAPAHLVDPDAETIATAVSLVERFQQGERFQAIVGSPIINRELEFILPWPSEGSERYLHGFIDCLYQDAEGEWRLVDYKSNQIAAEGVAQEARQYELQMFVYAIACERALGKRPVESVVCFLRPECEHLFAWTPEREQELTRILDDAIDSLIAPQYPNWP